MASRISIPHEMATVGSRCGVQRGFDSPSLPRPHGLGGANPQVVDCRDWRENWREQSVFGSTEPTVNGLEDRFGGDSSDEGSNPSPSVGAPELWPRWEIRPCVQHRLGGGACFRPQPAARFRVTPRSRANVGFPTQTGISPNMRPRRVSYFKDGDGSRTTTD